jgi:hypothetical protein
MIMAIAATYYPGRAAAVSGLLTASGIAGSVLYPPLVGFTSASLGLGAGMLGAAALGALSGVAVLAATRIARSRSWSLPGRATSGGATGH